MSGAGPREIRFEVPGLPPAKGEAKSMFAADHAHAQRVSDLLEAAGVAVARTGWITSTQPVMLTVELRAPSADLVWDATNYLGGIGDVLQAKGRLGEAVRLTLGPGGEVALFVDDRQIHAIDYRLVLGPELGYSVVVRVE